MRSVYNRYRTPPSVELLHRLYFREPSRRLHCISVCSIGLPLGQGSSPLLPLGTYLLWRDHVLMWKTVLTDCVVAVPLHCTQSAAAADHPFLFLFLLLLDRCVCLRYYFWSAGWLTKRGLPLLWSDGVENRGLAMRKEEAPVTIATTNGVRWWWCSFSSDAVRLRYGFWLVCAPGTRPLRTADGTTVLFFLGIFGSLKIPRKTRKPRKPKLSIKI